MHDVIEVDLDRVRAIITGLEGDRFSTADVIRGYCGGFFSNVATPAYYSLNAQFGKLLRRNADFLQIAHDEADVPIADDRDHKTRSSFWRRRA
ncbi:MAG: hypothetical protein JNN30_16225 [Rhodanobacteraceae bacterium]|nr:hypothetical protein [Rhodanobacteraceae bacterium]